MQLGIEEKKICVKWGINSEFFTTCEFNVFTYPPHAPVIKSLQVSLR